MLMPKRVKRRRVHRGRMKGTAQRGNIIAYGEYGLVHLVAGNDADAGLTIAPDGNVFNFH